MKERKGTEGKEENGERKKEGRKKKERTKERKNERKKGPEQWNFRSVSVSLSLLHTHALSICVSLTQSLRTFCRKRSVRSNTGGNRIRSCDEPGREAGRGVPQIVTPFERSDSSVARAAPRRPDDGVRRAVLASGAVASFLASAARV